MKKRVLSVADYGIILGTFLAVIGPSIALIVSRFSSIDTQLQSMNESLTDIRVSVAEISNSLSLVPSPLVSIFWIGIDPNNAPFSEYTASDEVWGGVFPEVALDWAAAANFKSVHFIAAGSALDASVASEFSYFATFVSDDTDLARALTLDGWSAVAVDRYFIDAGFEPFGYSVYISPRSVRAGYLPTLTQALDTLPNDSWVTWGTLIADASSP